MNLITELKSKINNKNSKLIKEFIEIIIEEKIYTLEQLEKLEDEYFTYNGKILNDEERIQKCIEILKHSYIDYDILSFGDIQIYKELKLELNENISNKQKIKNLILLFSMTNRDMLFLTETYNLIMNDEF